MSLIVLMFLALVIGGVRLSERGASAMYEKEYKEKRSFAKDSFDSFKQSYCSEAFDTLYNSDIGNELRNIKKGTTDEINKRIGKCYDEWINQIIYARMGLVRNEVAKYGISSLMKPPYTFKLGEYFDEYGFRKEQEMALEFAQWYEAEARAHGVDDRLIFVGANGNTTFDWAEDDPKANNYISELTPDDIGAGRFIWRKTAFLGNTRSRVFATAEDITRVKRIKKREDKKQSVKTY